MKALWLIILQILWRLRPVQALEVNLRDVIDIGLAMFSDDDDIAYIAETPAYRATLAAAFFDAHAKLDLLIYLRACEIAGLRPRITPFNPNHTCTPGSTDLIALWRAFNRLVARFDDYERHAMRRAERLKREDTAIPPSLRDSPHRLDAAHQSTSPGFAGGGLQATALCPPSRKARGRWIARACAQDGGGCVPARGCLHTRGPPPTPNSLFPTPHLARPARENAPA